MKPLLFLSLVLFISLSWFQFADSAGITQATNNQRIDIHQLIQMWTFDGVNPSTKTKSGMYKYENGRTKQKYRLDLEHPPTREGFNKYRIQSGSLTYAAVLIQPERDFGKRIIRGAFILSAKNAQVVTLGVPTVRTYNAIIANEVSEVEVDIDDMLDENIERDEAIAPDV